MIQVRDRVVKSTNRETELPVRIFVPEDGEDLKAVVLIVHGMMESIDDYDELGSVLSMNGYVAVVSEILGHGSAKVDGKTGYMGAGGKGYFCAVRDVKNVYYNICRDFNLPIILFGFSLGSFLVREALVLNLFDDFLKGVILMGTGNKSGVELAIGRALAKSRIRKYGGSNVSGVVDDLAVENYNKKFPETYEKNAWLIKDFSYLRRFNPGDYHVSPQMFYDLLGSMKLCSKSVGQLADVPLLLISGSKDPVTGDIAKLYAFFEKKGCGHVMSIAIPEYRHAILKDGCIEEVCRRLLFWLDRHFGG